MQGKRKPHSLLAGVQIGAATMEIHVENSQTAKNKHTVCLVITLLHICPKYSTSYSTDTCSAMFTNALFTIVKKWKQPKCPTTDGWVMERWYTYIVGIFSSYSVVKKNEIMNFSSKWTEPKKILLCGVNQTQKDNCYMLSLIGGS